jgi:tRNA dimethylallyltransferase
MRAVCVVGPTAAGKTAAAITIAERIGGEVLSCDSACVYRGLDIGTAKPTAADRARVPHHGLDVADPTERYSAARWAELADAALRDVGARGRPLVVVGGSGLYLRAWLYGLTATPPPDPAIRAAHRARPAHELHAELARVDPASARKIAPADFVRMSRALEVFEQTGQPLSTLQQGLGPQRVHVLMLGLAPARDELAARIEARVQAMLAAGLVEEVAGLVRKFGPDAVALRSVGYKELLDHVQGRESLSQARERLVRDTRRLARRQLTWFRGAAKGPIPTMWYAQAADLPMGEVERFLREENKAYPHGNRDG